jgi:hypothetical protein
MLDGLERERGKPHTHGTMGFYIFSVHRLHEAANNKKKASNEEKNINKNKVAGLQLGRTTM